MRLHYLPGTAAMAPHATLAEIGVPYELVRVERDENGRPSDAYLALNPWGKIPTLEDGDLVLTESAAICLYLAEKYPDARLAPPPGSRERAELYRWLLWLTNTVQPAQMRHFYPERYGGEGVKDAADAELAGHYDRIDAHLAGREWLVGGERTVADFFLFMLTRWGRFLEPAAWERPNLQAHWLRTLELSRPVGRCSRSRSCRYRSSRRLDADLFLETERLRLRRFTDERREPRRARRRSGGDEVHQRRSADAARRDRG